MSTNIRALISGLMEREPVHSESAVRPTPDPATARETGFVFAAIVLGAVLLFLSAPHHGEFTNSDSPRHALNGVFIKDLIVALPWHDPASWAMQYYVKYPALTILFYPPLFYFISAPFYVVFGVSHATGLVVVLIHFVAFAFGVYLLSRRWLSSVVAMTIGLSAMAAPGISLWGRQVMLEVPVMAFAIWSALLLVLYTDRGSSRLLYGALAVLLAAIYTKFSAVFLIPVFALTLIAHDPVGVWRGGRYWTAAGVFLLALTPVLILTAKFGSANIQSVMSIKDSVVPRWSVGGWIWYARQFPGQLGWPLLICAIAALPLLVFRRREACRPKAAALVLLLGWILVGYVFFSLIDLKESRHSTLLLPPILILAGLALELLLKRAAAAVAIGMLLITGGITLITEPVQTAAGYREAAIWIGNEAPSNGIVLFSGVRDGSFVFNMRANEARPDLYTVRADKLLLKIAVRRELGVESENKTEAEIGALLDQLGISYVVAQTDFWMDLEVMARLQSVLTSDHFQEVAHIPVVTNYPNQERELRIFRNLHEVKAEGVRLNLDLPIIGRSIQGVLPKRGD